MEVIMELQKNPLQAEELLKKSKKLSFIFMAVSIFTILNGAYILLYNVLSPVFLGLTSSEFSIVFYIVSSKQLNNPNLMQYAFIPTIILSIIFLIIWFFAFKGKIIAYYIGTILYGLDFILLIALFIQDFDMTFLGNLVIHLGIFLIILLGLQYITKSEEERTGIKKRFKRLNKG
jgi:hypothetical protein